MESEHVIPDNNTKFTFVENQRNGYYDAQKLNDTHKEILRRISLGEKVENIARDLQVTTQMVRYTKSGRLGQQKLDLLEGARDAGSIDVAQRIQEIAPRALEILEDLMNDDSTNKGLRARVADSLLDRAGYGAVKKVAIANTKVLTSNDIEEIKSRALAARRQNGQVVLVEKEDGTIEREGGTE